MTTRLTKILGFNLKQAMKQACVSQAYLAQRIKKVTLTVYNYLHDKTLPDLKTVNKLRAEFGYEPLKELPTLKTQPKVKITKTGKRTWKVGKRVEEKAKPAKNTTKSKKPKNEVTIEIRPVTI